MIKLRRPESVSKKKDKEGIFPVVGDDGVTRWYRDKSGEPVDSPLDKKHYRPYNAHDAERFGQMLSKGFSVNNALSELGIPYSTYIKWRRDRPEFSAIVDSARRLRSEGMHESFHEEMNATKVSTKIPKNFDEMRPSDLKWESARAQTKLAYLKVLEKKQKILKEFTKDDAPNRFGVQRSVVEHSGGTMLSLDLEVDEKIEKLITDSFRPRLAKDGGLVIKGLSQGGDDEDKVATQQK